MILGKRGEQRRSGDKQKEKRRRPGEIEDESIWRSGHQDRRKWARYHNKAEL